MSSFFSEKVLEICSLIPKGKVTTYSEIARYLGNPKAVRAVGNVLRQNKNPIVIPCHRVIRKNGSLGGYSGSHKLGITKKKELLEQEGVEIKNNKVDLNRFGFTYK